MAMAIVAMAFMGCTGIGSRKYPPAAMYMIPADRKIAVGFIPFTAIKPNASGRNIDRSPRDPAMFPTAALLPPLMGPSRLAPDAGRDAASPAAAFEGIAGSDHTGLRSITGM